MAPVETAGSFPITYDPPFFSIEVQAEGGGWGVVLYEVLEDEGLVMLHDYLWMH